MIVVTKTHLVARCWRYVFMIPIVTDKVQHVAMPKIAKLAPQTILARKSSG